jgi:hypothetical protein
MLDTFMGKPACCACSNTNCMHVFFIVPRSRQDFDVCPKCKSVCYVSYGENGEYEKQYNDQGDEGFPGDGSRWEEI